MIYYATFLAHVALLALMGVAAGWVRHLSRHLLLCLGGVAGVGAYMTAILSTQFNVTPVVALVVAGFAGFGCGALLGLIAWRLRGTSFVLILLAVQVFFQEAVYPFRAWTHGSDGIDRVPALVGGGFAGRAWATAIIASALTLVAACWLKRIRSAPLGLAVRAFGDNPDEFVRRGFKGRWPLLWTYSVAGLLSSLAGGLLATTTGLVTPGEIGFAVSVTAAVVVLLPMEIWVGDYLAPFAAALCVNGIRNLVETGFARFLAHDASWFWHAQVLREVLVGGLLLWLLVPARPPRVYQETGATPIDHDRALALLELEEPLDPIRSPTCVLSEVSVRCDGQLLLSSVSFEVAPGSVTALVGPNGSGKTTALLVLLGKYAAPDGTVVRPALNMIGYLSGSDRPFSGLTSLENIRLYRARPKNQGMIASILNPAAAPTAEDLLDALGVGHRKDALGEQLSWGQSRRIVLAGLLCQKPWQLLLLDEPTSGLDTPTRDFIAVIVGWLKQRHRAIVVAEHDRRFVQRVADQIIYLGGKDESHQPRLVDAAPPRAPTAPILSVVSLAAGFRGVSVVENVSFTVGPGQIVVVTGRNGCGKSTLLRTLIRQLPPVSGTFETAFHLGRGGMAYLGETAVYENLTVAQNVEEAEGLGSGLPGCVRRLHAWTICHRLWARQAGTLSLGEKRWLRMTMALAQGPTLLILDEPSLNLSPRSIEEMVEDIRDYARIQKAGVVVADQTIGPWLEANATPYLIDDTGFRLVSRSQPSG